MQGRIGVRVFIRIELVEHLPILTAYVMGIGRADCLEIGRDPYHEAIALDTSLAWLNTT